MDYLTAAEIAKIWNISNRMVAYYCEAGRIDGAIKKGKVWFIPANAKKPIDKRSSKQRTQNTSSLQGKSYDSSETGIDKIYHTSDIYNNLGLTRETLRYYEDIGLIKPKRSQSSQYREFDLFDISRLMSIDFFKKRGFSPNEICALLKAGDQDGYANVVHKKIRDLENNIRRMQEIVGLLKDTENFCCNIPKQMGEFIIRELPAYYIQDSIPSITSFEEYRDKVLCYLNGENEDILSNMVRAITFDETGYKDSEIYIVKPAARANKACESVFLESGKCLYTTLIADNNDTSVPERMFQACHEWAAKNDISFRGVVYIFIRFVLLNEDIDRNLYEIWVPIK